MIYLSQSMEEKMKKEVSFNNQKLYNCTTKETFAEYLE